MFCKVGWGDDALDGKQGNDILAGGTGNDTLTGGAGTDQFHFSGSGGLFGRDVVTDFTRGQDDIYIYNQVFSNFADILSHTANDGLGNTVISTDADHTIVLLGVLKTELLSSDFHLV